MDFCIGNNVDCHRCDKHWLCLLYTNVDTFQKNEGASQTFMRYELSHLFLKFLTSNL